MIFKLKVFHMTDPKKLGECDWKESVHQEEICNEQEDRFIGRGADGCRGILEKEKQNKGIKMFE